MYNILENIMFETKLDGNNTRHHLFVIRKNLIVNQKRSYKWQV
jgi:hypothetical protein